MNQMVAGVPVIGLGLVVAYFFGSIPFGYLIVRATSGRDLRNIGSGNIGATNVARASGYVSGVATLLLDAAKGYLAVWLMGKISEGNIRFMAFAALAAVVGHVFPVWLGLKGGKGVATAAGVFLIICPPAIGAAAVVFVLVLAFWRYISLASISAAAALPLLVYVLYAPRHAPPVAVSTCTMLIAALVIFKHRSNIERLMTGAEPRVERNHIEKR